MRYEIAISTKSTKGEIANSLAHIFTDYQEKRSGIESISGFVNNKIDLTSYFLSGNRIGSYMAKELFKAEGAISALNSEFWSKVINLTDVLECMPANKRNEWSAMIHDMKTPDFVPETVISTITDLLLSRDTFLAEKVDGLFRKLSGSHVTNTPEGFNKRMIIESVLDRYGWLNHHQVEYIHDLRQIIAKLMHRDTAKSNNTRSDLEVIRKTEDFGNWHEFDGGALKIKIYKKGTAHIEIHPEVAAELNSILALLYPQAIPSKHRTKSAKPVKDQVLKKTLISFGAINILSRVLEGLSRGQSEVSLRHDDDKVEDQELTALILSTIGGVYKDSSWSFDYDAKRPIAMIIRTGAFPEHISHQFYPTKRDLAQQAVDCAEISPEDTILEPSAGTGGLAGLLPTNQTQCVEINEAFCEVLSAKGFEVTQGDFLKLNFTQNFSKVIMNPPFTDRQAEAHLTKAAGLVADGGALVAILPASLKNKVVLEGFDFSWSEDIEDAFDNTKVRVVILKASKR